MDSVVLLSSIGFLLGLGAWASRGVSTTDDWMVAGRSLGFPVLLGTLVMTELNTSTLLAFSSPGYGVGWWALWFPCLFLFGLSIYTVTVARRWQRLPVRSIAQYFGMRFGPEFQAVATVFLLTAMLGFCATYVRSTDLIFAPVFDSWWGAPVSPWASSAAVGLVVLAVTLGGGLVSVARTDFAAFLLTLVLFPAFAFRCWWNSPPIGPVFASVDAPTLIPPSFLLSLAVLTACTYMASPWYGQRMFAAKDETTAVRAVGLAALLVTFLYGAAVVVAVSLRADGVELENPELAVPTALWRYAPVGLRGLGYAVLFSISVTTISSIWNTWVAMALAHRPDVSIAQTRWTTVALAIGSWVLANIAVDNVLNKMILANVPIASLAFGILGGLFWAKSSRWGVASSIVVGFAGACFAYGWWGDAGGYTLWWAFGVLPTSIIVGIIVSLLAPDTDDRAGDFYRLTSPPLVGKVPGNKPEMAK